MIEDIIIFWIKLNIATWIAGIIFTIIIRIRERSLKKYLLDSKMQGTWKEVILSLLAVPFAFFLIVTYQSAKDTAKIMDKQIDKDRLKHLQGRMKKQ